MPDKQVAGFIVVTFIILGILGILSAVAIPHADRMAFDSKAEAMEMEYLKIQTAVAEMLRESPSAKLTPVGPTADMRRVRTADAEPLFLTDYLAVEGDGVLGSGYVYCFAADGTVIQMKALPATE